MKVFEVRSIYLRAAALVLMAILCFSGTVAGQTSDAWKPYVRLGLEAGYNDNVFLLSPGQKQALERATPEIADREDPPEGSVGNGRFDDMESVDDVIVTAGAVIGVQGPGVGRRRLRILPSVEYVHYVRNAERRHFTLGLAVVQSLPHRQRLRLQAALRPRYFQRNYLADAVDRNENGSIEPDERVYASGIYQRSRLSLDYRARLLKSTKQRMIGVDVELGVGYERRDYKDPFGGRDRRGPVAEVALAVSPSRTFDVELGYAFAAPSATPTQEVLLLDENLFGVDFNGNGVATDSLARAFEFVDRSRLEHVLGVAANIGLGRRSVLTALYQYRLRNYTSEEPFDVSHNGRRDRRHRGGVVLEAGLAKRLTLVARADYNDQTSNRPGDPGSTGEIADYERLRASVGLSYRL